MLSSHVLVTISDLTKLPSHGTRRRRHPATEGVVMLR